MTSKKAELLSKQWLMGVRRGWVSLLKPNINSWGDVFRAFAKLTEFVDNLEKQVLYVRRAPLALPNSAEGRKLSEQFEKLRAAIGEAQSRAKHWATIAEGRSNLATTPMDQENAEKMFNLYRQDFEETFTTYVPTKGRGPGGVREASITELLDKVLVTLRENAKRLDKAIKTEEEMGMDSTKRVFEEPAFEEFQYGNIKVVVTDPKMGGNLIRSYIKHFERFYELMKRKGFGKALYGTLFLESASPKQLSEAEQERYAKAGYWGLRTTGGTYSPRKDVVVITNAPTERLPYLLAHEYGHRYWFKSMSSAQRAKFDALVRTNTKSAPQPSLPTMFVDDKRDEVMDKTADVLSAVKMLEEAKEEPRQAIDDVQKALKRPMMQLARFISDLKRDVKPYVDPRDSDVRRVWGEVQKKISKMTEQEKQLNVLFREARSEFFDFDRNRTAWADEMRKRVFGVEGEVINYLHTVEASVTQGVVDSAPRMDPNDPRQVLPVSEYGNTNADEAFAEVFAHYVTGENMTRGQLESFRSVLTASENPSLAEVIVQRYLYDRN